MVRRMCVTACLGRRIFGFGVQAPEARAPGRPGTLKMEASHDGNWDELLPHGILVFEDAAQCTAALAKLNAPRRQKVHWTAEALDDVRVKIARPAPKSRRHFKTTIVIPHLGKNAPPLLGPDEAGAAEPRAAETRAAAPRAAEPRAVEPRADALCDEGASEAGAAAPSAAALMARALALVGGARLEGVQYTFHERLGGGVSGKVVRVTGAHGRILAAKCIRVAKDNLVMMGELHLNLTAGAHPHLLPLVDVTLGSQGRLCLLFPCPEGDFAGYLAAQTGKAQPSQMLRDGRDALAALLPAIAHLHRKRIIHTDVKPANMLLETATQSRCFGGRRLLLADLGSAILDEPACRLYTARASILQEGTLFICTPSYMAPELLYGEAAFTEVIDEWAAGAVAWETIRGQPWPLQGGKPAMRAIFGSDAVRRVFRGAPLFAAIEGGSPDVQGQRRPGEELNGTGRVVLQSLLTLEPAERGRARELQTSDWFAQRPVLRRTVVARGGKGPFAVAEAYMGEEVLAELQSDALWTSARQEALDLSFARKSSDARFAATQSHEHVGGKPVKLSIAGHYGRGSASDSANGLATKDPLPCEAPNCFVEFIVEHNAAQWEALFSGIRAAIRKEFADELPSKAGAFANVNDFLSDKLTWRDFLFTAPEIHFQAVQDSSADEGEAAGLCPMPIHYDGGRGFIVLSFSLWTSRVVRMWHADGAVTDMRAEPGHCYLADFIGVEHQVLHARAAARPAGAILQPQPSGSSKPFISAAARRSGTTSAATSAGSGKVSRVDCVLAPARRTPSGRRRRRSRSRASRT